MRTFIDIDVSMLAAVRELGGFATEREAVNVALAELARKLAARKLLEMRCTVELEGDLGLQQRSRFPGEDQGR
jgi:Arc/MetJ family transcription regulator